LIVLPEKTRRTLERLVNAMRIKEDVYGIGLFGSLSRGEAVPSSDVDLFILDAGHFKYEYVERVETGGLLVDLDHVPKQCFETLVPPEIDQKLHEMQILYDRDWSLTNTKLLMDKSFSSPERVDIRTEGHVIDSDIYLSRATSAFSRDDFQSACLFATVALEHILRVLVEIALVPFSNSHFFEALEASMEKLAMQDLYAEYLNIAGLDNVDRAGVKDKIKLFKAIWDEIDHAVDQNSSVFASAHFKIRTKLNYLLNPAFMRGLLLRANALADEDKVAEASHYVGNVLLDLVENYAWLRASAGKMRREYARLMRLLERLERKNPKNLERIIAFMELADVDESRAEDAIERIRKIVLRVRLERKVLIRKFFA